MSAEEWTPPVVEQQADTLAEDSDPNHETLYSRLRSQVEFYFSPQNLSRDNYLRNMLTSEHPDMPTPRPAQFMCPVGVITSFPKVQNMCAESSLSSEPPPVLLAKALEGTGNIVTISQDGNWIGPTNQQLPPPANMMGQMGGATPMGGQLPSRAPGQYQMPPFPQGGVPYGMNPMQGMMMVPPPPPPPVPPQGGDQGAMMYQQQQQQQQPRMQYNTGAPQVGQPPNATSLGSESPSLASLESDGKQQHQLNKLDASEKVSLGTTSVASLSSMSVPGQQQPIPMMGQQQGGSVYPLPQGPSTTPPMSLNQNANVMPYPMAPLMQQSLGPGMPPPGPGPGGMPQPYPYYAQQMPQQGVYPPGTYMQQMQPQQQQPGVPQQPMQMQQAYPPHPQMGYGMPPPPPHGYPGGGPPPTYPYQAMQQYMDGYGAGGGQQGHYGYPPNPHQRQFNDNRHHQNHHHNHHHQRVGSPGINNDNQHGGQQNKKAEKKKKKKNQQQHQQHRGESYGSGSTDNNGQRNYAHHQHFRHDHSTSPPVGDQNRGGGKMWKNRGGSGGDQSSFRRHGNNTSPSFNSKGYNRHHQHANRLSSSDTTPSKGSSLNRQQLQHQSKADDRDIFTTTDFPGLGGGAGGDDDKSEIEKKLNSNVGCYASALLKKKEALGEVMNNTEPAATDKNDEADSIIRQTEEMEREILSEFHDLSLIGNDGNGDDANTHNNDISDKAEGCQHTVGTSSSSTMAMEAPQKSPQPTVNNSLPILPARPFESAAVRVAVSQADHHPMSEASPVKQAELPVIDVTNSEDFPSRESAKAVTSVLPPLPGAAPGDLGEKPQPSGPWGSKKLFSDVI